jgi:hypothetical protein
MSEVMASSAGIVYVSGIGEIYYNSNGAGAGLGNGALIATLEDSPAIDATNFMLAQA